MMIMTMIMRKVEFFGDFNVRLLIYLRLYLGFDMLTYYWGKLEQLMFV